MFRKRIPQRVNHKEKDTVCDNSILPDDKINFTLGFFICSRAPFVVLFFVISEIGGFELQTIGL